MKFNLKHFLAKRNLTIVEWARSHGIDSIETYDKFMLNGEFENDPTLREELKLEFFKVFIKKAEETLNVQKTEESKQDEQPVEVVEAKTESTVVESNKTPASTEDKAAKKKRSKGDTNSV